MSLVASKVKLGQWPTPLAELPALSEYLGIRLSIKRDDLSGLALGGNKTRKLETILGAALEQGCDTIITAGAAQSNHCRQTAAAAAMLGLECHLLLGGDEPKQHQGNLLLDVLFGAQIHWSGENRKGETIPALVAKLNSQGKKTFVVPYGGSNALGALAYAEAHLELCEQTQQLYDYAIFASSSGGTQAGLLLGNLIDRRAHNVVGINIDKTDDGDQFTASIAKLANEAALLAKLDVEVSDSDVVLNSNFLGDGYGVIGAAEREAISLMASLEGILVDPVYSGRALAGLIGMVRSGEIEQDCSVLFWHTGGAPALFAYSSEL